MLKLPQFLGLVATCIIGTAITYWFGNIGLLRVLGAVFVIGAIAMIFAPQIEMGAKGFEGVMVSGWPKIFAIVPMLVIGCGTFWFAPELTCKTIRGKTTDECKLYYVNKEGTTPTAPSMPTPP